MPAATDKNNLIIYRRILRLDELLSPGRYPSLQELIADEELTASRTTIFRTIDFMRNQLHAPVVFDKKHGGYGYSEKTFRLPAFFSSEQELFAAELMQNMAAKLKGTPLYENALSILDYIQNNTVRNPNEREFSNDKNGKENTNLEWARDRYIFLSSENSSVEKETWSTLERTMKSCRQIEFDYHWKKENQLIKIKFNPYQVANSSGRWYLWGYDCAIKDNRLFLLDLISGVKIIPKEFKLPKDLQWF
jgi:predicted DNA-binding transcriptional regulator YafY